uniref:ORF_05L n=1 Tax=Human herpesvirus 1 (strain R15) TaxID=36345 RepID=Q6VB58_HHV1R|nr:ORF_05L [Human alphaherpesvirus 1 strain R-15]
MGPGVPWSWYRPRPQTARAGSPPGGSSQTPQTHPPDAQRGTRGVLGFPA